MATRDNQTLQIIIISLCFLLVLTGVAAVFGWRYYADATQQLADAAAENSRGRDELRTQLEETKALKQYLGFKEEDNLETVRTDYDEDMKVLGATFSDADKNYRTIAERLHSEVQQLTQNEKSARESFQKLEKQFLALEAESKDRIAEFEKKSQAESMAAAAARQTFDEDRATFEQERQSLLDSIQQQKDQFATDLAAKDAQIAAMTTELTEKNQRIADLQAGRPQDHTVFERPDGRVTLVNQGTGKVWINLGYADALREQISFSVYDEANPVAGQSEPKAKIEVIRIAGEHLAEASITEDEPLNPIVPGDQIYSPVWERGKQVRFALTGLVDFDGDGRDDSERARRLITSSGGAVDAYVNEAGDQVGQMTINTRFLIAGEQPEGRDAELLKKQSDARQEMLAEAEDKGVDVISVDKFLSFVGWRPEEKVVTLGTGAQGADFPPVPRTEGGRSVSTGSTSDAPASELFRKRFPVTPY
jgi:hypothetical protein